MSELKGLIVLVHIGQEVVSLRAVRWLLVHHSNSHKCKNTFRPTLELYQKQVELQQPTKRKNKWKTSLMTILSIEIIDSPSHSSLLRRGPLT
ncbi:unnamed protein product [Allacma fusca]|uniref:Uncharacterized protein n=1 Tax=Allacma fusca TaxID=39272 RepID=A0A8J2LHT6_9HEXA|nr:unnamed protein product [Allacma fusca]